VIGRFLFKMIVFVQNDWIILLIPKVFCSLGIPKVFCSNVSLGMGIDNVFIDERYYNRSIELN
jgi:hypothetical protein